MLHKPSQSEHKRLNRNERGFSLIELLIVVAIILVIVAIAIPNYLRSRMVANEAAAVESLRNINTGSVVYNTSYANGYPPSLAALGPTGGGGAPTCDASILIDDVLSSGTKSGYTFVYSGGVPNAVPASGCAQPGFGSFSVQANPIAPGYSGERFFFIDQSGAIRQSYVGPATVNDGPML